MKVCLYSDYSKNNKDVFNLTIGNHNEYCLQHGYTKITTVSEYSPYLNLDFISYLTAMYDIVVIIGTDILINKTNTPIEDLVKGDITMCREMTLHNRGKDYNPPFNGDFIILKSGKELLTKLNNVANLQKEYDNTQNALTRLNIVTDNPILQIAHPYTNSKIDYSNYNLDDYFSFHFHTIGDPPSVNTKVEGLRRYLEDVCK